MATSGDKRDDNLLCQFPMLEPSTWCTFSSSVLLQQKSAHWEIDALPNISFGTFRDGKDPYVKYLQMPGQ